MDDLISRQAAIDAADYTDYAGLAVEDVKKVTDEVVKELRHLPSAQQWVPVTERLPSQTGEYLVTVYYKRTFFIDKFVYTPTVDGWCDPETDFDWNDYVIAWMPLPGAYKGEKNG